MKNKKENLKPSASEGSEGLVGASPRASKGRDFFAAAALQGLCANPNWYNPEDIAERAWRMADMMLELQSHE
jgi:hypothetical protein